jgi:hypothetical protein
MQSSPAAYLQVPVNVELCETTLPGSLCIPQTATALGLCIEHPGEERYHRNLVRQLAAVGVAALTVRPERQLSLNEMVALVDWVRSRKLLRSLPIGLIAPAPEGPAALKAAEHRPVAVPAVLVMSPRSSALPAALRWLRGRLSARPNAERRFSVAYSA